MAQPERLRRPSPRGRGRAAFTSEPGHALRRADVDRLLDLDPHHLLARLVERQHRVVVHLELAPVNLGLKHLRPRNHVVPEDDLLRRPPELQHRQQLPARHNVPVNRVVHPRPEHLPDVAPRRPPRRDVEPVGLRPPLRVQRQRHLLHPNRVVQRVPPVLRPQAVLANAIQPLQADLAHARRHAPRLHRLAPRQGVFAFHSGIARNALLAHSGRAPIHRLLVRTLLHALLVPPAPVLVDQHDPVLPPLVDRLPGAPSRPPRRALGVCALPGCPPPPPPYPPPPPPPPPSRRKPAGPRRRAWSPRCSTTCTPAPC